MRWSSLSYFVVALSIGLASVPASEGPPSPIRSDEAVLFYPTFAWRESGSQAWKAAIHGSVFEPEERSLKRALMVRMLRKMIPRELSPQEKEIFNRRVRLFLVDPERGKRISIRFGPSVFPVGKSGEDGHFRGEVRLTDEQISALFGGKPPADQWASFSAVTPPRDSRVFAGRILAMTPDGVSVVSDIDDTIKVTNVRDRSQMLENTFLRPFVAVPGMAAAYASMADRKAAFHYVSASPWQLYPALADFLRDAGFPEGTLHMKSVRLSGSSLLDLVGSQEDYKTGQIEVLLRTFLRRRFILIGDSGEQDPEIYGSLARKHGEQIQAIWIRNVSEETADNRRCRSAFEGVPRTRWLLFRDAAELRDRLSLDPAKPPPLKTPGVPSDTR